MTIIEIVNHAKSMIRVMKTSTQRFHEKKLICVHETKCSARKYESMQKVCGSVRVELITCSQSDHMKAQQEQNKTDPDREAGNSLITETRTRRIDVLVVSVRSYPAVGPGTVTSCHVICNSVM